MNRHLAEETRAITSALDEYVSTHLVSRAGAFICRFRDECKHTVVQRSAARKVQCHFVSGESPFIGERYALADDSGRMFRVVAVGKERGGDESNMTMSRRAQVLRGYVDRHAETKHLKGTFLALATLLNAEGVSPRSTTEIDGSVRHVSESFALINSVACSAKEALERRQSDPTPAMKQNCREHLLSALDAARPTVVIVQGDLAHAALSAKIEDFPKKPMGGPLQRPIAGRMTWFASFVHPSARRDQAWSQSSDAYFLQTVKPTMLEIRSRLVP